MYNENISINSAQRAKSLIEYRCKQAILLLREHITEIPNVQSWAKQAGISRRWLCKSMKTVYGKPPKVILREVKYEKMVLLILEEGLDASCYSVAVDSGFGSAKNGSRFLSSHYNTTFTELKMDLLKEDIHINFLWYNGSKP